MTGIAPRPTVCVRLCPVVFLISYRLEYPYLSSLLHPAHFLSFSPSVFPLSNFSPPSFFPPSSLALSPPLPLFSSASCKNHPLPSLRLSVHAQKSECAPVLGWLFVWVTMWVCMCYFDNRRGREGQIKRKGDEGEGYWTWPCGWCFGIGTVAYLQEWVFDEECVWDGIRSGQKTSSWEKRKKN